MASPCEVHVGAVGKATAREVVDAVAAEARRVEREFSRYVTGNIVDRINSANGEAVTVDPETAGLLEFAAELHRLSSGAFDITSGVLRRAWTFDGGSTLPRQADIDELLPLVGWHRVHWANPVLQMPVGMQIDFGGIGKEYAVDRAAQIARERAQEYMVNFGGDLAARGRGSDGLGWSVGVEASSRAGRPGVRIRLQNGALATSGDAYRFVAHEGRRYGHILDARTGWPVADAPRSVTVAASNCTSAGMFATLAILHGADAEAFLDAQRVQHWCLR